MKMLVNQPYGNHPASVLGAALRFVRAIDKDLIRLSNLWRPLSDGIALYDPTSNQTTRFGRPVELSDDSSQNSFKYFRVGDTWYECDDTITREEMEQVLQILNDVYGDSYFVAPTPIGYAHYL
ncbi:MAG: hypothetical protein IJK79_08005 [Bacteroidales bacterium]|nr:hypothetical protein [Bacteroidales bacterium]MBR0300154.1 hypothetical protein [Bacteroidales bacterium]